MFVVPGELVFIHLPKTGGIWTRQALQKLGYRPTHQRIVHAPASCTPEEHSGLPMFGYIRSPWDWYCSLFAFCTTEGARYRSTRNWLRLAGNEFSGFVTKLANLDDGSESSQAIRDWLFDDASAESPEAFSDCGKHIGSICGSGQGFYTWLVNLIFDDPAVRIYKYEDGVPEVFCQAMSDMGKVTGVPRLPKINFSKRGSCEEMYQGRLDLIDLIAEKDKAVIDRFGYSWPSTTN